MCIFITCNNKNIQKLYIKGGPKKTCWSTFSNFSFTFLAKGWHYRYSQWGRHGQRVGWASCHLASNFAKFSNCRRFSIRENIPGANMRNRQDVQRKKYFCGAALACEDNNDFKYCIYDTFKSNLYILYISIAYI